MRVRTDPRPVIKSDHKKRIFNCVEVASVLLIQYQEVLTGLKRVMNVSLRSL